MLVLWCWEGVIVFSFGPSFYLSSMLVYREGCEGHKCLMYCLQRKVVGIIVRSVCVSFVDRFLFVV